MNIVRRYAPIALVILAAAVVGFTLGHGGVKSAHATGASEGSPAPAAKARVSWGTAPQTPGAGLTPCSAQLDQCRLASAQLAIRCPPQGNGHAQKDPAQQKHDALAQLALDEMREDWERRLPRLKHQMRRDLRLASRDHPSFERQVASLHSVLGLDEHDQDALRDAYDEVRAPIWEAAQQAAFEGADGDWSKVANLAREMFLAEDNLVREHGGSEKLETWRAQSMKRRARVLGMLVTAAGEPWDGNIDW